MWTLIFMFLFHTITEVQPLFRYRMQTMKKERLLWAQKEKFGKHGYYHQLQYRFPRSSKEKLTLKHGIYLVYIHGYPIQYA